MPGLLIIGAGVSGQSVARLARHLKVEFDIFDDFLSEDEISNNVCELKRLIDYKQIVVSPGIAVNEDFFSKFLVPDSDRGIVIKRLMTEFDFAGQYMEDEKFVAVTGSLGKSTVVSALSQALEANNVDVFLGGNIGFPLCDYVFQRKSQQREKAEYCVLELSSYQLELLKKKVSVGALLNVFPNHLDRYKDIEEYTDAKLRLFDLTEECFFINEEIQNKIEGKKTRAKVKFLSFDKEQAPLKNNLRVAKILLKQLSQNFADDSLEHFSSLEHRFETLCRQPWWVVNDSKSTTPEVSLAAVQSVLADEKIAEVMFLVGGRSKKLDWGCLKELSAERRCRVFAFGESRREISEVIEVEQQFSSMEEATQVALNDLKDASALLLSPGAASQDEFKNFSERGRVFKSIVRKFIDER